MSVVLSPSEHGFGHHLSSGQTIGADRGTAMGGCGRRCTSWSRLASHVEWIGAQRKQAWTHADPQPCVAASARSNKDGWSDKDIIAHDSIALHSFTFSTDYNAVKGSNSSAGFSI